MSTETEVSTQPCARCAAPTPSAHLFMSAHGEICASCMQEEEVLDRMAMEGDSATYADGRSTGIPPAAIWIGLLVLINVLSAVFDWPFWVY